MKVHMHTKFCFICLFTFIFHHCNHCHDYAHDHTSEESHDHRHNDYQISEAPYLQSRASEPSTSKSSPPEAEREQTYYIEKLFHHYGDNGKLSYSGLEKLLSSLGLGEVKVVEIGHEDVGHDHGSHSDTSHDHVDSHSHLKDKNESKTVLECKMKKTTAPPEHKSTHKNHSHHHVHNGTHHSHNHSHHNHNVSHVSLDGQTNEPLPGTNTTQEQTEKKMHKHKKKRKGTKTTEASLDSQSDFEQAHNGNKRGYKHDHNSATSLVPGNGDHDNLESEEHVQGVENIQRNTRKREAPNEHTSMKSHGVQKSHGQHGDEAHEHDEVRGVASKE